MIYGYIRVSSDKQTVENQRFEIEQFCIQQNIRVDGWIQETISGTQCFDRRLLGQFLKNIKKEDMIICSEISRLGRNVFMVMEILNICLERGCQEWSIKDGYRLGTDIQSKVLAFAFGLAAEIERMLISQRTKEALARKRSEGIVLGRPKGRTTQEEKYKLYSYKARFAEDLEAGLSQREIANKYGLDRSTVHRYIKRFLNATDGK